MNQGKLYEKICHSRHNEGFTQVEFYQGVAKHNDIECWCLEIPGGALVPVALESEPTELYTHRTSEQDGQ